MTSRPDSSKASPWVRRAWRSDGTPGAMRGSLGPTTGSTSRSSAFMAGAMRTWSASAQNKDTMVTHICDVDSRELTSSRPRRKSNSSRPPSGPGLQQTPRDERHRRDHDRHAGALARADGDPGLQAGKHVYVEKPCSHNPARRRVAHRRRRRNTASSCRWATSSARLRTPSRSSEDPRRDYRPAVFRPGLVLQHADRRSASARRCRCRRSSIGSSGRARRRGARTRTTCFPTTGTGSGTGAPARRSTTARTRWMSAAGRLAWIIRSG